MTHEFNPSVGCRNSGMPLGGIGAGSVELRPDGYFHRWYIMNNYEWGAGPYTTIMEREGLRFGMLCRGTTSGEIRHFALAMDTGLDPIPDGWFWNSDPYHLPWVQHPDAIEFSARIPFARLEYKYGPAPVAISLDAWSPLVPYDVAASNTPGCELRFTVKNTSREAQHISLWGLLKNAVGYDHPELPDTMRFDSATSSIVMSRSGLPANHVSAGSMALGVDVAFPGDRGRSEVSFALHPRHGRDIWDPIDANGRLENQDFAVGTVKVGEIGAEKELAGSVGHRRGAVCADFELAAGSACAVTFTLTWFFPNLAQLSDGQASASAEVIGHYYANRFDDAVGVLKFLRAQRGALEEKSRRFVDDFYATSLPVWMLDAVNAQFSPLLRSSWLDKLGRFGVWEGLGRCGLQTVDVSHYANFLAMQLWPQLDESQQRLVIANTNSQGKVPHTMAGDFANGERNCDKRIDLCAQFVMAIWRYTLWAGELSLARDAWPVIERNLQILAELDTDGDGLPNARGSDQTYDRFDVIGSSALINFGYVPGLLAASELAQWLGHEAAAKAYAAKAQSAYDTAHGQLWNGQYYDLCIDPASGKRNSGCLSDQVNGFWFYQQTNGNPWLEPARVSSVCRSILKHNLRTEGPAGWLVNCSWPLGGTIPFHRNGSDQAKSPWSGVEYALAAYLVLNGMRDEGRSVMRHAYERYERSGMRFNHYECGEFYHRAMAAFAVYNAEFGIHYNAFTRTLRVKVPEPLQDATFLVALPSGYAVARYTARDRKVAVEPRLGNFKVDRIEVVK